MASLGELRDALTALGLSTSTGVARGDERRAILQQRLREAQQKLGLISPEVTLRTEKNAAPDSQMATGSVRAYGSMSLSELRAEMEARQLPTHTPGLKGEARRHALIQRLQNSVGGTNESSHEPQHSSDKSCEDMDDTKSSRSSTSSYSAAGEVVFFDETPAVKAVPVLVLPTSSKKVGTKRARGEQEGQGPALSDQVRKELERELLELRNQLHDERARRSQQTSRRLQAAGFELTLDDLSSKMMRLENERQRLLRVAFGHELVVTTILRDQRMELVQEDAIRLIEQHQHLLRSQIKNFKQAMKLTAGDDPYQDEIKLERDLEASIRRIEMQFQLYNAPSRVNMDGDSSWRSSCPSACSTRHGELEVSDKEKLAHELRAARSFHIRRDRICVDKASLTARPEERVSKAQHSILAFSRYPPTAADKLGVKALFLEQSQRNIVEIQRVYKQALALEPTHAVVLGNYARLLYEKCGKHDEAEHTFEQAIQADPLSAGNLVSFAFFLHHTRHAFDRAEQLYLQALKIAPMDPVTMGNYASLLRNAAKGRVSQLLQAKELLLQAIRLDETVLTNRLRLCAVLEDLGDIKQALNLFEDLVNSVKPEVQNFLDQEKNQAGSTPRTATTLAAYAHVYGNFGNFLMRQGILHRAKRMYEIAIRLRLADPLLQRN